MDEPTKPAIRRALNGEEKLWKVWWLGGIPVAGATSALSIFAENARQGGYGGWGDGLDVAKLLIYLLWARLAWRCSRNVDNGIWTPVSQVALGLGLVLVVLL
jgi:hypothetical protein